MTDETTKPENDTASASPHERFVNCPCVSWNRGDGPLLTSHHRDCQNVDYEKEIAETIKNLCAALEDWGNQEDGIPEDYWLAYEHGKSMVTGRMPKLGR